MMDQHAGGAGRARRDERQIRTEAENSRPLSLSLGDLCAARDERERRLEGQAAETARRRLERRAGDRRRFEALVLTEADREGVLSKAKVAFEAGQREAMLVSFPSDFCTDGGRRVNNRLPGWQDTLPGGTRALHGFWREALRPGGFGFGARILNFPAGVLGDVGLFVTWPQNAAA